jgi:hypothetical protein
VDDEQPTLYDVDRILPFVNYIPVW